MKSLKVKIKLDKLQQIQINTLSNEHRLLYNHLLDFVKKNDVCDFKKINNEYKNYRLNNKLTINSKSAQNTSRTFINNIKSYFALIKTDKTARFPNTFKSWKYFTSFQYDCNNGSGGYKLKDNCLIINLLNKSKIHIDLPDYCNILNNDMVKTVTFMKTKNDYYLCFSYNDKNRLKNDLDTNNFISIDLGISNLYTFVSNKINSESLVNSRFENLERQIKYIQSIQDKKKKYSKHWKKINKRYIRLKRKLADKNKDFQHKVSTNLIKQCKENNIGAIICGDIKVKKIINKENKRLKSASKNSGLSRFKTFLEYKSKNEGMIFDKVNEAYTSQRNSYTNNIEYKNLKLSDREVYLTNTVKIDRDLNSAINIAKKIKGKWLTQIEDFEKIISNFHKIYMNNSSATIYI